MGLNSQITALLGLGADAMDNLYDIKITFPEKLNTLVGENAEGNQTFAKNMMIRADGFAPPKFGQSLYEIRYKTVGIKRPAPQITGDRQFDITFRLDANYQVYKYLLAWRSFSFAPDTGYAANAIGGSEESVTEINKHLGTVKVVALAAPISQGNMKEYQDKLGVAKGDMTSPENGAEDIDSSSISWNFENVWISDVDEPSFKNGGGGIMSIKATFQFGAYSTPLLHPDFVAKTPTASADAT